MDRYKKIYEMALYEGMKDAYNDYLNNKRNKFKKIKDKEVKSVIYDKGYCKGYNIFFNIVKKN